MKIKNVLIVVLIAYAFGFLTMYVINRMGFKEVTTITIKQEKGDILTNKNTQYKISPSGGKIKSILYSESTGNVEVLIKVPPLKSHSVNFGIMPYYDIDDPQGGVFFSIGYERRKGRFGYGVSIAYDPINERMGIQGSLSVSWGG